MQTLKLLTLLCLYRIISGHAAAEEKVLDADFMIADFEGFKKTITQIYENCRDNYGGKVCILLLMYTLTYPRKLQTLIFFYLTGI